MKSIMAPGGIQLLVLLLAAFASVGYARAPQKIQHGEDASILDFPYHVFLESDQDHGSVSHCMGTILDAKHILTAAHCLYQFNSTLVISADRVYVFAGLQTLQNVSTENVFSVMEIFLHPDYNITGGSENDIAILKLYGSISFDSIHKPAVLPTEDISEGAEAIMIGRKHIPVNDTHSTIIPELQKLKVTVFNSTECSLKMEWWQSHSSKICTMSKGSGAACPGDSGSSLSFNGTLVGIVSQGICKAGDPVIFTRVYSYLPWIKSITERQDIVSKYKDFMWSLIKLIKNMIN